MPTIKCPDLGCDSNNDGECTLKKVILQGPLCQCVSRNYVFKLSGIISKEEAKRLKEYLQGD